MANVRPADWSELHWAVWCHDLHQVKNLLGSQQANIEAVDNQGWTALHLACCSQRSKLWRIRQIEERGLDPNGAVAIELSRRPNAAARYPLLGYTYSHYTVDPPGFAENCVSYMITLELLQAGANPQPEPERRNTWAVSPLDCAANSGWVHHLCTLLSCNISISKTSSLDRCTAICWASGPTEDHQRCYEYLRKKVGPDAWSRIRNHGQRSHTGCGPIHAFSWPTSDFQHWYLDIVVPHISRPCLPGSFGAVNLQQTGSLDGCPACSAISLEALTSPPGYVHASSINKLRLQGTKCDLCKFLFSLVAHRTSITLESDASQVILRAGKDLMSGQKLSTLILQVSSGCYCHTLQHQGTESRSRNFSQCIGRCGALLMEDIKLDLFTANLDKAKLHNLEYGQVPSQSSASNDSIATSISWYNQCQSTHGRCRRRFSGHDGKLPTRVIDVTQSESTGSIKLVVAGEMTGKYVALSHRWASGPTPLWATRTANEAERLQGFNKGILPISLRDAIYYTWRIGMRYIWIDSLCILQDSAQDWKAESAKMLEVFGTATLTLFADAAMNDDDAFLKIRQSGRFQNRNAVSFEVSSLIDGSLNVQAIERYKRCSPEPVAKATEVFRADIVESHLTNRGWIFQEQVISPRRLHFGQHQIYWICEQTSQAEDGTDIEKVTPDWMKWLFVRNSAETPQFGMERRQQAQNALGRHKNWARLVENYTRRSLTCHQDKLIALSGQAKSFARRERDVYIIGCWESCLRLNLLWTAIPIPSPDPEAYARSEAMLRGGLQFPSWTWLAADGAVQYPHLDSRNTTRTEQTGIMHVYFQLRENPTCMYEDGDGDRFGLTPIYCTPLEVEGCLEPAHCISAEPDGQWPPPWPGTFTTASTSSFNLYDEEERPIGSMIPDRICEPPTSRVMLLKSWEAVGACTCCNDEKSTNSNFIVLESVDPGREEDGVYRRIGYGWVHCRGEEGVIHHSRWRDFVRLSII